MHLEFQSSPSTLFSSVNFLPPSNVTIKQLTSPSETGGVKGSKHRVYMLITLQCLGLESVTQKKRSESLSHRWKSKFMSCLKISSMVPSFDDLSISNAFATPLESEEGVNIEALFKQNGLSPSKLGTWVSANEFQQPANGQIWYKATGNRIRILILVCSQKVSAQKYNYPSSSCSSTTSFLMSADSSEHYSEAFPSKYYTWDSGRLQRPFNISKSALFVQHERVFLLLNLMDKCKLGAWNGHDLANIGFNKTSIIDISMEEENQYDETREELQSGGEAIELRLVSECSVIVEKTQVVACDETPSFFQIQVRTHLHEIQNLQENSVSCNNYIQINKMKAITVSLQREDEKSLGIVLTEKEILDGMGDRRRVLLIKRIIAGGIADKSDKLQAGDQIIAINGIKLNKNNTNPNVWKENMTLNLEEDGAYPLYASVGFLQKYAAELLGKADQVVSLDITRDGSKHTKDEISVNNSTEEVCHLQASGHSLERLTVMNSKIIMIKQASTTSRSSSACTKRKSTSPPSQGQENRFRDSSYGAFMPKLAPTGSEELTKNTRLSQNDAASLEPFACPYKDDEIYSEDGYDEEDDECIVATVCNESLNSLPKVDMPIIEIQMKQPEQVRLKKQSLCECGLHPHGVKLRKDQPKTSKPVCSHAFCQGYCKRTIIRSCTCSPKHVHRFVKNSIEDMRECQTRGPIGSTGSCKDPKMDEVEIIRRKLENMTDDQWYGLLTVLNVMGRNSRDKEMPELSDTPEPPQREKACLTIKNLHEDDVRSGCDKSTELHISHSKNEMPIRSSFKYVTHRRDKNVKRNLQIIKF